MVSRRRFGTERRASAPGDFQPSHSPIREVEEDQNERSRGSTYKDGRRPSLFRSPLVPSSVDHSEKQFGILGTPSPNELRVALDRLHTVDRSIFDKLSHDHYASHGPVFRDPSTFRIEPMHHEAFIGAWMHLRDECKNLDTSRLLRRQQLVQLLTETRFDSMQRFISFCVLFHAMGKAVADFWPRVSCGILRYDMSRSQSIMRVATTASPVAGTEVRDRLVEIQLHMKQLQAASTIQRIWRSVRLLRRSLRVVRSAQARN